MTLRSPLLLIAAVIAGCYTGSAVDTNAGPWIIADAGTTTTDTNETLPTSGPGSNDHGLTHLPCDVEKLLERACWDCHGTVPGFDATSSLVTLDDLKAPSVAIPSMTQAEVSLMRMSSAKTPMPPDGLLAAADVATLQKWFDAGMPEGQCGATCTSGKTVATTSPSALTNPGASCGGCHKTDFAVSGTVYATAGEPDNCAGEADTKVILIDADGEPHTMATNAVGNFWTTDSIKLPYRAMVVRSGTKGTTIREMTAAQTNGDCNGCHAASPTNGVPGRIMAPSATTKE